MQRISLALMQPLKITRPSRQSRLDQIYHAEDPLLKKIIILTMFAADDLCGGAAIIRYWVSRMRGAHVFWLSLSKDSGRVPLQLPQIAQRETYALDARGNTWPGLHRLWKWSYRTLWARHVARRWQSRIEEINPDLIWVVFDHGLGPVLARIGPSLADRRLHFSLHDEPSATAQREGFGPAFVSEIETAKSYLRNGNPSFDAVTEELAAAMLVDPSAAIVVTLPADPMQCADAFRGPPGEGPLRIGFSGNFQGNREFHAFVAALNRWSGRSGREWSLVAYGNFGFAKLDARIQAFGPTVPDIVRAGLACCDAFLLPLPIDRPEMLTSLPTKLVTYAEFGRPVFTIAPKGSATERIVKAHKIGPVVTTTEERSLDAAVERLTTWNGTEARDGWSDLVSTRFGRDRIAADLEDVLGISFGPRATAELLPA